MALKLSKDTPAEHELKLDGGAIVWVRPAEYFEHVQAEHKAIALIAGLVVGQDAAMRATALLGRQFRDADFTDAAWVRAAEQGIMLLELAGLCITRWQGMVDDAEQPLPEPTREYIALLLRDPEIAKRVLAALRAKVNVEVAEKNGYAASPNGVAATEATTAGDAASLTSRAPGA